MKRLELVIPGKAPSENHMWHKTTGKHGQTMNIYKKDARAWYDMVTLITRQQMSRQRWTSPEPREWVILQIYFYFPNRAHPDPSNCLKALLDALEDGGVYPNDKYVLPQVMGVSFDKENPRTEVLAFVQPMQR